MFDFCGKLKIDDVFVEDEKVRVRNAKRYIKQYILALKSLIAYNIYFELILPDSIRIKESSPVLYLLDLPFILEGPTEQIGSGYFSFFSPPETILQLPYVPEKAMVWSVGVLLYKLLLNRYPFSSSMTLTRQRRARRGVQV